MQISACNLSFFAQIFMDNLVKIVECVKNDLTICENGYIFTQAKIEQRSKNINEEGMNGLERDV